MDAIRKILEGRRYKRVLKLALKRELIRDLTISEQLEKLSIEYNKINPYINININLNN